MSRHYWTAEQEDWMRENVPGRSAFEIIEKFDADFGIRLNVSQVKNEKSKLGLHSGTVGGRFVKGQEPPNKGRPWSEWMPVESQAGCRRTQFKKGNVSGRAAKIEQPVGSERISKDGYVEVKVAEGLQSKPNCNFRFKHHIVWEEANGKPVPPSTMIVFADHDKRNFDPDNLVAVPRKLWAVLQKRRFSYFDRESLETCMNVAMLEHEQYALRCRPRPCKRCGNTFKPRYANQKTCDVCLGRSEG